MNINTINEAIETLENSETTVENVTKLSTLYIVRDHLKTQENSVENELSDILPAYLHYIEEKRRFQMKEISEDIVIERFSETCKQLKEFICALYSGTNSWKERKKLKIALEETIEKCFQTR